MKKYVIYTRVSTREQGDSGLGLDAQLNTCRKYVESKQGEIVGEFYDVKSGSSRNRTGLINALAKARENDAILVFAKLDRLARDAEYAHSIRNSGIELYFCDFPQINSLLFGILVAVAQYEKELGQKRTKDALDSIVREIEVSGYHTSVKTGNDVRFLGKPKGYIPEEAIRMSVQSRIDRIGADLNRKRQYMLMRELRARGDSYDVIAGTLNATGESTPSGKDWNKQSVGHAITNWDKFFN